MDSVIYIVDDQDVAIEYLCPTNHQLVSQSYYHNTWSTVQSSGCDDGWFKYSFTGSRIRIQSGITRWGQHYRVKLDNGNLLIETGNGNYDSGVLTGGRHNITYAIGLDDLFPAFDYLTVTASESTIMQGRTVVVDDASSAIKFHGSGWTMNNLSDATFDYSTGPYQDSLHWSRTAGDSFSVKFIGTSVAVYGVHTDTTSNGNITLSYSLDGGESTTVYPVTDRTRRTVPMARLFQADMDAGEHVLAVNITDVIAGYPIGIDFVAYNASYNSISELRSSSGSKKATHIGAIVGGVLGGLAFIGLCALLYYITRSRVKRKERTRVASMVIGRNYNSQLDVKTVTVPRPVAANNSNDSEAYPMPTLQFERDQKTGF